MLIKPLDAVLVEFTNDATHLVDPNRSIGLASNVWFSIASVLFLTVIIAFISDRMIEPRLGAYKPRQAAAGHDDEQGAMLVGAGIARPAVRRFTGCIGLVVVFCLADDSRPGRRCAIPTPAS